MNLSFKLEVDFSVNIKYECTNAISDNANAGKGHNKP